MTEPDNFVPDRILTFKDTKERKLKLHVFNPSGPTPSSPPPVIIFFFGGGWMGGSPAQFHPHCHHYASKGMVAISAEYRVQNQDGTTPIECVKDGKSAIRWVRQHASELGIDPSKVIAGGGSAGGHVAATCGTLSSFDDEGDDLSVSCVPQALVLFNPVFDNGPGGYGHDRVGEVWEEFSPLHNLDASTPPTIVHLGTHDKLIPVETAKVYQEKMTSMGVPCELVLYEGKQHGFFNFSQDKESYQKTIKESDRFLANLGFLPQV